MIFHPYSTSYCHRPQPGGSLLWTPGTSHRSAAWRCFTLCWTAGPAALCTLQPAVLLYTVLCCGMIGAYVTLCTILYLILINSYCLLVHFPHSLMMHPGRTGSIETYIKGLACKQLPVLLATARLLLALPLMLLLLLSSTVVTFLNIAILYFIAFCCSPLVC